MDDGRAPVDKSEPESNRKGSRLNVVQSPVPDSLPLEFLFLHKLRKFMGKLPIAFNYTERRYYAPFLGSNSKVIRYLGTS